MLGATGVEIAVQVSVVVDRVAASMIVFLGRCYYLCNGLHLAVVVTGVVDLRFLQSLVGLPGLVQVLLVLEVTHLGLAELLLMVVALGYPIVLLLELSDRFGLVVVLAP